MKYVVSFSLSTIAAAAIIVGLAVSVTCATLIVCSYHPSTSGVSRPLAPRKVTTPIQLPSQGSIGATKEAQLEAQYGRVDKSSAHEVKEGLFDRFRRSRQTNYVQYQATRQGCSNCGQGAIVYRPSHTHATPAPEPMPQIDPSSYADGSYALKDVNPFQFLSPVLTQPSCATGNCNKVPSLFGN